MSSSCALRHWAEGIRQVCMDYMRIPRLLDVQLQILLTKCMYV